MYRNTTDCQRNLEKAKQLEESTFLTSDYTSKLQSSRQHGAITKIEVYRNIEQWNKIESPEINSCTLFLTVGGEEYKMEKKQSLQ